MTYDYIDSFVKDKELPIVGVNDKGEPLIIQAGKNGIGKYYQTDTSQDNGWIRKNIYYEDGSYEELYEK